jgi:hypothetical protein
MKPLSDWVHTIEERMPLYGHRNWIAVVDAAYPAQSGPGIETILSGESQQVTMETLLAHLRTCRHVRPIVHVDRELEFVDEKDAPGVGGYRQWLQTTLEGLTVNFAPHEEIIAKLDRAAQMFSILIIKSTMAIPYTSVFIELDCGYWDPDSEARMRAAILRRESQP